MSAAPVGILVCALGGEGGGVLSEWVYDTAARCGHCAQTTAIPGVAQRSGATTYYIEVDPLPGAQRQQPPVFGLYPVPGALDLLLSSELLETVRQIGQGYANPERTWVISSSARTLTTAEKMAPADGRVDAARLAEIVRRYARTAHLLDMNVLAQRARAPISAVLFGALAASGVLPFPRAAYEQTIRASGKSVDANLRAFALAYEAVAAGTAARTQTPRADTAPLAPELRTEFPPALHDVLALALPRLAEYQDGNYVQLYLSRVRRVLQAERAADPDGRHDWAATREAARLLALWMTFDDIARVAQRKLAAARRARVRREAGAGADDVVKIYDYFKPGVPEFAAALPPALARRLLEWERRRRERGKPPLTVPIRLPTHTIAGTLALRLLAASRRLRRYGSRWQEEQAAIGRWLAAVDSGLRSDWRLGYEIAQCARLVKGYGETHERGRQRFETILSQIVAGGAFPDAAARAEAVARARTAALADAEGRALSAEAARLGVTVPERPLRFVPRRPAPQRSAARRPPN
jgi:indolepyruvate ferredoxin oxidoreductase beta subunit